LLVFALAAMVVAQGLEVSMTMLGVLVRWGG
jgi:hypothetical protein